MFLSNIRIINLSLEKLRLIAQTRNIREYESKSKEDLIKGLGETKPKPEVPKPEIIPKQTPKLKLEPEIEIIINRKK